MKIHSYLKIAALAACALLGATTGQAAVYHVTVNTTPLLNTPASASGPFSLDFQLTGGNSLGNTATVSNFTFGGGSASGSATTFGGASGSLGSGVTLSDSSNFSNELFQSFNPGSTLGFDVSLTNNINSTPDLFYFAILDSALDPITTNAASGDSLFTATIDNVSPTLKFNSGTGNFVGVAAVPEPATACWSACVGLVLSLRRIRNRRA